jgi:hypothetical protein
MLFSFANWVVRLSKPRRVRARKQLRSVRRLPACLELLEDRTVLDTVRWVNPNGGDWGVAANWDLRVPLSGDDVVIPANFNNINVNHTTGTDTVASLDSEQNLNVITAGSLTVTGAFTQGSNRTLTVSTVFTANGATNINNANLSAVSGGHINLPGATGFDGTGNRTLRFDANGAGSMIDLSNVTQFKGAGGPDDFNQIQVWAQNGGTIDLRHVTTVSQGNIYFFAWGTGGQLILLALTSFTGARNDSSQMRADSGGTILAPGLTAVNTINLLQNGDATLPTTMLSTFVNSNASVFSVAGSGALRLLAVTNFDGTGNRNLRLEANGAGSKLDLSNVTQFTGAGGPGKFNQIQVWAQNGGTIDLRHVTTVSQGNTYFLTGGTGGQLILLALTSFTGARNDSSEMRADLGGTILAPGLTSVNNISLVQTGDATLPTTVLSSFQNSNAQVFSASGSGTLRLPALTNFDGTGNRNLRLDANGAGSLLDLSNVTQFTGAGGPGDFNQIWVWAENGGRIDLRHVVTVNQGNTFFFAWGTGGQLNLSALTGFTGARNDSSEMRADLGGTILAPGLTSVNNISLVQTGDATLPTAMLSSFQNSNASVSSVVGSGTLRLLAVTNFDGTGNRSLRLEANGPGSMLDLSNVTQFKGAGGPADFNQIQVWAQNLGAIDLRHVVTINEGNVYFFAGGSGQVNLSAMTSFTGARSDSSLLSLSMGGMMTLNNGTTTVNAVTVQMSTPCTITVGTLQLATGSSLSTAGTIMGSLDNRTQVQVNGAAHILTITGTYTQSGMLSGAGNLNVGGLTTWTAGTMSGTGQTNANGGLSLGGPANKTLDGRLLNDGGAGIWSGLGDLSMGNGASLNLSAQANLDAQNDQSITNGVGGAATLNNAGTFKKSAGTGITTIQVAVNNTGTLQVQTGTISLTGAFAQFSGMTLLAGRYLISGTLRFTGANVVSNAANIVLDGGAAQITDLSGANAMANLATNNGSLTIQIGDSLSTGVDFSNTATLIVGDGSSFATSGSFSNSGSVTIGNGSNLSAGGDYVQTDGSTVLGGGMLSAGGTVNLQGGVLSGSGTLIGTVVNAAEIDVGTSTDVGLMLVSGDYSQTGNLVMKIGGADPSLYDQLAIGDNATFAGGTLTIVLTGGYMPDPTVPDTFQIVTFGTHDPSDDFGTYVGTDLGGGVMLLPQYSDTDLTLVTTQTSSPERMTGKTPPIELSVDPNDLRPNGVPVDLEAWLGLDSTEERVTQRERGEAWFALLGKTTQIRDSVFGGPDSSE